MKYLLILLLILVPAYFAVAQTERPNLILSQAEMTKSGGGAFDEFRWLNTSNASLSKSVASFPSTGSYRFDLSGYMTKGLPQVALLIDGVIRGYFIYASTNTSIQSVFLDNITAGNHSVTLKLTNFTSGTNHCRVALLYATRTALKTPYVYPTPGFMSIPPAGQYVKAGNFYNSGFRGYNLSRVSTLAELTAKNIPAAAATGANVGRYWIAVHHDGSNNYYYTSSNSTDLGSTPLTTLDSAVKIAEQQKFYLILTLEVYPDQGDLDIWGTTADAIARKQGLKKIWADLANRYKSKSIIAAYDFINEPRMTSGNSNFNFAEYVRWTQDLIDTVRTVDTNHVVVMEVMHNAMLKTMLPLPFTNVVYSPHAYTPFDVTHQGVNTGYVVSNSTVETRKPYPSSDNDSADVRGGQQSNRAWSLRFNVPMWIGEFSCINWAPIGPNNTWSSTAWVRDVTNLFEEFGWSYSYHAWREFQGWEAEIPSQWYVDEGYTFLNAAPFNSDTRPNTGTWNAGRSPTAPTLVVLKAQFAKNVTKAAPMTTRTFVVFFSSRSYSAIIGSSNAPYINTLLPKGTLLTNANGLSHADYPNYAAFFAGSKLAITTDDCITDRPYTYNNIWSSLNAVSRKFAWYSESLPVKGYAGCASLPYVEKHNPTTIITGVPDSINKVFSSFNWTDTSVKNMAKLEHVVVISPNVSNDMDQGTVAVADTWLQTNFSKIIEWCRNNNSVFVVTVDESGDAASNHVPVIIVGQHIKEGFTTNVFYDHIHWTKTICSWNGAANNWTNLASKIVIKDIYR